MKTLLTTIVLVSVLFVGEAWAHNSAHPKKPVAAPVNAEQMEFGIAGDPAKVTRTINVSMSDNMRFTPSHIQIKEGETVKFIVKNDGKLMHEMVIGTMKDLKEHAELMRKYPDMEHDAPYMAHVQPGNTEVIVWRFNKTGEFNIACLVAGHFEAGMVGKLVVR